jgi:hypothetical protein
MTTPKLMDIWKLTLAWGCLGVFFSFPIVMVTIHLSTSPNNPAFATEFRYLAEYMRTVTAIIISLAGFSTVELFRKSPDPK